VRFEDLPTTLALMRGDDVPDAEPIFDRTAPPPADHVDLSTMASAPAGAPLGGPRREPPAPGRLAAQDDEEIEDEGGEDAWSLTRNGRRDDF